MCIQEIDPRSASDEQLLAMHAIERACLVEMIPGDPGRSADEAIGFYRHAPATQTNVHWLAGEAATASLFIHSPAAVYLQLYVAPVHRRRGLGTALLDSAVARAREAGAMRLFGSHATGDGAAFARRVGAVDAQREVKSLLDLSAAELPEPRPPAGWRLETWIGSVPEEHIEAYVRARAAMDDAPDAGDEHPEPTVERVRASEESLRQRGREMRLTAALQGGELGAFTELRLSPGAAAGFTDDTGTVSRHRGQGLATAVKLESLRRFRADHPEVRLVTTSNDETNTAMLAVNRKLGFVAAATFTRAALDL